LSEISLHPIPEAVHAAEDFDDDSKLDLIERNTIRHTPYERKWNPRGITDQDAPYEVRNAADAIPLRSMSWRLWTIPIRSH
jgi:hypothetical protein